MLSHIPGDEVRQIFLSLPVAACLLDRDFRFVAANEKYATLLDTPLANLKGKSIAEVCPPEVVANAQRDFEMLDACQSISDYETAFEGRSYLISVGPLCQQDCPQPTSMSVAIADISDLKRLEAELAAANEKLSSAYEQISTLAETDALTGLLNRYGLRNVMDQEARRCRRNRHALAVAIVDVDWFKPYNDLYGHLAGDVTLQAVGAAIKSAIRRPGDRAARYGGEEFVVVLPNTSSSGAGHVGAAIKQAVHDLAIRHDGSLKGRITVSVGVASIERVPRGEELETVCQTLLHNADQALYAAKRNGRNVVEVFSPVIEHQQLYRL